MQRKIVTAGILGLLSTSWAFSDERVADTRTDRVTMFAVPFKCQAAPQIGCGSISKPILLELERNPAISEAWLNRTGTILAVVGTEASNREGISKAVESVLEKNRVSVNELTGDAYATELKSFTAGTGWYRGADVDALSKIEARAIAQRILHRLQTSVTLTPGKATALEDGIADAFERRFIGSSNGTDPAPKREELIEEISTVAKANLNEKEFTALEAAFAKGIRPLPEDSENPKSKSATPACCRFPSQS